MANKPIYAMVLTVAGIMMLSLLATKPLANQAFAKSSCDLGILAHGVTGPVAKGETIPVSMNVGLSCPAGSPVSGATVNISGQAGSKSVTTDSRGLGSATFDLGPSSSPYTFKANYAGDSQHDAATAGTGFFIDEK